MILVDSSVIIDFLRNQNNERVALFDDIIGKRIPWGISEFIYQEILQGSKDEKEFEKLKEYLDTIPIYFLKYGKVSFDRAAMLNVRCRRSGVTISSTIDFLIAETAMENDVSLLHNDQDFDNMSTIITELRQFKDNFF